MTTRRDFLKLAGSSGLLVSVPTVSALTKPSYSVAGQSLSLFVFDEGEPAGRDIAMQLDSARVRSIAAGSDLTDILKTDILPKLGACQFRAAGITQAFPAYAAGEIVRDYGYAITFASHAWQSPSESLVDVPSTLSTMPVLNYVDCGLSNEEPIFWVLAPSGINFRA